MTKLSYLLAAAAAIAIVTPTFAQDAPKAGATINQGAAPTGEVKRDEGKPQEGRSCKIGTRTCVPPFFDQLPASLPDLFLPALALFQKVDGRFHFFDLRTEGRADEFGVGFFLGPNRLDLLGVERGAFTQRVAQGARYISG